MPEIRWMVNTGNTRRESTQAFLIPLLAEAGFNVIADNCEAAVRVPAAPASTRLRHGHVHLDRTAGPDVPHPVFTCDQIPTEENDFQGQNQQGGATRKLRPHSNEADLDDRRGCSRRARQERPDWRWTRTSCSCRCQFPKSGVYRTDKLGGPVEEQIDQLPGLQQLLRVGGRRR